MLQAVADPFDVVLDADDHVDEHRRAAGARDDEQVGEPFGHEPEVRARAVAPLVGNRHAAAAPDVDGEDRPGERVVAGRADERVEFVEACGRAHAARRDRLDRRLLEVHEFDVVAVVDAVVAGIDADALRAERVVVRAERLGDLRVLDDRADLLANELRDRVVRRLVDHQVVERMDEVDAALAPPPLVLAPPFFLADLARALGAELVEGSDLARARPVLGVAVLPRLLGLGLERLVPRRDREVGGALEHDEACGLARDRGDGLDAGRAGADHADPEPAEVDALVGPGAGVIDTACERVDPADVRQARHRERSACHDDEAGRDRATAVARLLPLAGLLVECRLFLAGFGAQLPAAARRVEAHRPDARVEPDVAAQIEPVGDVLDVAQDLGLRRVFLGPDPLLLELVRERVRVLHALDVAARAGIPVPVPHAADVGSGLVDAHGEAQPA